MDSADGRVILFIVVGIALFVLGRRVQFMVTMWRLWKDTVAAVPGRKQAAYGSVKTVFKAAVIVVIVLWVVVHANRLM